MLNELREYEEYTIPVDKLAGDGRLLYDNLKDDHSGIDRAMTTVARHFLFRNAEKTPGGTEDLRPDVGYAQKALKAWCGFLGEEAAEEPELQAINGWLQAYIQHLNSQGKGRSGIKDISGKKTQFSQKLFTVKTQKPSPGTRKNGSGNNYKKITYERVIADALLLGPLSRYYLICETDELFQRWTVQKNGKTVRPEKPNGIKDVNLLLLLTAACLLGFPTSGRRFVPFNKVDVNNWHNKGKKEDIANAMKTFRFSEHGAAPFRPIFEKQLIGGNTAKVRLDDLWAQQFMIVEESRLRAALQEKPGRIFYSDLGSCSGSDHPLWKGVWYS